jgi:hypothetical protein
MAHKNDDAGGERMNTALAIEKLYNQILHEMQALYAIIATDRLAYDYDSYIRDVSKLIAIGDLLGLDTKEVSA